MAEFGIPDEPGFRGTPVLGPLAASVAGFTQGIQRGLQSRQEKKGALAKQRAEEKVAKLRAGATASSKFKSGFGNLTKGEKDKVKDSANRLAALKKELGNVLSNLTDDQKTRIQFDINVLTDEITTSRTSISSFARAETMASGLTPSQQTTINENFLNVTQFRDFDDFPAFVKFKKEFIAQFDPQVGQVLGELLEAERERKTIILRTDILGPGEIIFDKEDEDFLDGLFE